MRKLITFFLLLWAVVLHAQQITPDEAAAIASEFLSSSSPQLTTAKRVGVKRAKAKSDADNDLARPYYVFNGDNNRGFVIVSGDKRAKKILGYSDTGTFDFDNLPPQLATILEQYAEQIKSLPESAATAPSWSAPTHTASTGEGKLLETANWGQGYPYNKLCPVTYSHKLCWTGCTATAMAIIMRYHKWPENGQGEHHYTWSDFNNDTETWVEQTLMTNFENTHYDYNIMPIRENEFTTSESIDAVAGLMRDVGISINTSYSCEGSSAWSWDIAYAMKEYFKYDKTCQLIARKNFEDSEWNHLIISQLDKGYPIIYLGTNSQLEGHAFILDGYDGSMNYFHFNWGWEGASNGYYTLDATEDDTMITFNKEQKMVINLIPDHLPREYSRATVEYPHRLAGEKNIGIGLNINVSEIKSGEPFDINTNILVLPSEFCGWYGYAIVDKENNIKEIVWESSKECVDYGRVLCPSTQVSGVKISLTSEELDETDKLQVVTKYDGEDVWRIVPGTLEAPASCPVSGNKPELSRVVLNIDDALEVYLSTKHYFYNYGCSENYRFEGKEYRPMSGTRIYYRIVTKEVKPDYVITFDVDNFFNGEQMNRVRTTIFDKDEVCGFFDVDKSIFNLTAKYQKTLIMNVQTHKGGELSNLINQDDARIISNLTISGPLNAYDIWYMNDYFQCLALLDISNTYFEEIFIDNPIRYNSYVSWTQSAEQLPDVSFWELKRLQVVKLPDYLKYIGHNCFQLAYSIKRFELPKNIEKIGVNLLFECIKLEELYSFNPNPPIFIGEVGNFWDPYSFEQVKVFVPIGAKEKYQAAPVWNRFVNIEEFNPTIPVLAKSLILNPETWSGTEGESFQITAVVEPENATDKTVAWSSSDETVATVDATGYVNVLKGGSCVITASTQDGSGLSAECIITCVSGIDDIFTDADARFDVYNLQGILVKKDCGRNDLKQLPTGTYILRQGDVSRKIIIQ